MYLEAILFDTKQWIVLLLDSEKFIEILIRSLIAGALVRSNNVRDHYREGD